MDEMWLLGLGLLLVADLAIGIVIGWIWCRAAFHSPETVVADRHDDRGALEELFRRNDELFRVIYTVLRQSREYTQRLGHLRDSVSELPPATATRLVTDLIESVCAMHGDLSTSQERLQRQLELSKEATLTARREYSCQEPSVPPAEVDANGTEHKPRMLASAREEERAPYQQEQSVAPYANGKIPRLEMFQRVECCDLSRGGVSFFIPERPKSDMIVITIGDEPNLVYRTARVVEVVEVEGKFRVGCQFTGRLHRHLFA